MSRTSGPTALVTGPSALASGATGFLGAHLAELLHRRGYRVRALARSAGDVRHLEQLGVEIAPGDVSDPEALRRAAEGQRFVFHTAGKVTDWGPPEEFLRANRDGTSHVIAACQEAGVERLVHVSSLTVLGLPRDGRVVDERSPYAQVPPDAYTESKVAGERLVREAHGRRGLAVTVVRHGVIWGAGDVTIVPRIVELLRRGRMLYIGGGRNLLGLSHVDNLAAGAVLAAESPAGAGEVYHLTDGEDITGREAIDALAEVFGTRRPWVSLPFPAVYALATAMELAARALRRTEPPMLTRYGVRLVACHCRYDLGKARRELGYRPARTFREGIAQLAGPGARPGAGRPAGPRGRG